MGCCESEEDKKGSERHMRVDEKPKLNYIWVNCTGGGRVRGLGKQAGILKILCVSLGSSYVKETERLI